MRLTTPLIALVLTCGSAYASAPHVSTAPSTDSAALETTFVVSSATRVPGKVLKAGSYVISIKDHLTDRAILQISSSDGKLQATFLGALHSGLQSAPAPGPIKASVDKGHDALRGFTFPGGGTVEFVYPKAEAAELVSKTAEPVLAIDPASDNLHPAAGASLSREDSQMVTLWSLQATRLSPTQTGISAKKFVGQPDAASAVAQVKAPVAGPAAPSTTVAAIKRPAPARSSQMAVNRIPSVKALPKTASNMPLLLLSIMTSFGVAFVLRAARLRQA